MDEAPDLRRSAPPPRTAAAGLCGRDRQLAALAAAYDAASEGRPRVVVVEAEPGMGKTALLQAFQQTLPRPVTARLNCDAAEQVIDLNALEMLMRGDALSASSAVEAGRSVLAWLGRAQHRREPVVLLLDDVQWMDLASVEALRFALRRLRADRVLTVITRRPPAVADAWASVVADTQQTLHLRLGPLAASDVVRWAAEVRGWTLPLTAAARLVRHTGGVPLLLQAVLHEVPDGAILSSHADLPVPSSVSALAARALAPLEEDGQRVLQALAVLNESTDRLTLGSVPGLADPVVGLASALQSRLVTLDHTTDHLRFDHGLYRDAVYDQIDLPQRRTLHQWAAGRSGTPRSYAHRVAAAVRPDADLCAELVEVAQRVREVAMPALAASFALLARRVATEGRVRDALLFEALHDLLAADDLRGAGALRTAVEQALGSGERSFALGVLAHHEGRVREAEGLLVEALQLADGDQAADLRARANLELGTLYAALNDGSAVLEAARQARAALPTPPAAVSSERLAQTVALEAVGLWETDRSAAALTLLSEVRPSRRGSRWEPDVFAARGMIRYWRGDPAGALEDLDHAISLPANWGSVLMRDRVHAQRFLAHFLLGRWDAASIDANAACVLADSGERPWMVPLAHAVAALVPAMRGEWELAEDHLRKAEDGQQRIPSLQAKSMIANARWHLAVGRGDHQRAHDILAMVLADDGLERLLAVRSYRWAYLGLCQAVIRLGDLARAEDLVANYADLVRTRPEAPASARLPGLRGQLAEALDDVETADRWYEEQLADHAGETPWGRAETLLASGRLRRSRGRRRDAVDRLTEARTILVPLRAWPLLSQVDAELAACGLPAATQAPLGLTEREQDVAALVARGMTNSEIAGEIYLTTKTVEYHLRNIFAKLGLANRRELRRLLTG